MSRNLKELETSYEELKQKVNHYEKNYILPMKIWLGSEFGYGDSQTKGNTGDRIEKVYQKVFENGLQSNVRELMEFKKSFKKAMWFMGTALIMMLVGIWGNLINNNINKEAQDKQQVEMVKEISKEIIKELREE